MINNSNELSMKIKKLIKNPPSNATITVISTNQIQVALFAPITSPFRDGIYRFNISFNNDFPVSAPIVKISPPIYHPNVSQATGIVNISYLNNWTIEYRIDLLIEHLHVY